MHIDCDFNTSKMHHQAQEHLPGQVAVAPVQEPHPSFHSLQSQFPFYQTFHHGLPLSIVHRPMQALYLV